MGYGNQRNIKNGSGFVGMDLVSFYICKYQDDDCEHPRTCLVKGVIDCKSPISEPMLFTKTSVEKIIPFNVQSLQVNMVSLNEW